ncbi:MAG TPA: hypothetical protein VFU10_11565 [Gaiellaceae bacterium]|nr:hypothetical protein [Gaiellaceae bacterium]
MLAQDERADPSVAAACGDLADHVAVVPAATHMERYLGWLHGRCSGDWILRVDDDEVPSAALLRALPQLLCERELTHYWLPRWWVDPTADTRIAEGPWAADLQVRLVRNLPGLWRFPGRLHTNIDVLGASRVLDEPLLHLVLRLSTLEQRRAKVAAYERLLPGMMHESGRPLNEVFVPEDVGALRHERLTDADVAQINYFTAQLGAPARRHQAASVERPLPADLERWLDDRSVSDAAYRASVQLVDKLSAMPAEAIRHMRVEVANLGADVWPRGPDPEPPISVGHRWRRADGSFVETPTPRTPFTETVAPGATTRLTVALEAPSETGELELVVDVVHEWVRWFECAATQTVSITSPYTEGFYAAVGESSNRSAEVTLPLIFELTPVTSIIDVGCGTGAWLRAAIQLGVRDVLGVDGPWVTAQELQIPPDAYRRADLATPVSFGRRFDLALALEVAEHLPADSADVFVKTLVDAAPVVAFSAAVPGQGGTAHLNEQWPAYWVARFAQHGYEALDCMRPAIWDDDRVEWWYAQNLILFVRREALEANPRLREHRRRGEVPLALVHPRRVL